MIYKSWRAIPEGIWRWPNFSPIELACRCGCEEFYLDEDALDKLQAARRIIGKPLTINSAHRCARHNAKIGGAPASQHKKIAFDVSITRHGAQAIFDACREGGLTTFGFYQTFLHTDTRLGKRGRGRRWISKGKITRGVWRGIADIPIK